MPLTTVLFDLDGTLLPMEQKAFTKAYFGLLAQKLAPHGYKPDDLIAGIWAGIKAMVKNDGSRTNEEAFWDTFSSLFGEKVLDDKPIFEEFYRVEFQQVQAACGFNPAAKETVSRLKEKGLRLVLATNPIFPAVATRSRLRWAGLDDGDFEMVTAYEDTHYCKPNPRYYREILDKLGLSPEECLLVGNDATEDVAATALGMPVFLLPDCLLNDDNVDISPYPQGSFDDLQAYIDTLL